MTPEVFYFFYFLCLTSFSSLHLLNSFLFLFPFIFHTLFVAFYLLHLPSSNLLPLFLFFPSFPLHHSFISYSLLSVIFSLFLFLFLTLSLFSSLFSFFLLSFHSPNPIFILIFIPISSNFCSYSYFHLTHLIRHCAQSRHRRRRCRKSRNGQEGS